MKATTKLAIAAALGTFMMVSNAQAAGLIGTWTTQKGWKIKMYKCGAAFCGKVIGGTKATDVHNPKKSMRSRKMVGVRMVWGMKKSGSGYAGKLYNPNDGKIYTGKMSLSGASSLKLSGCVFGGLICKSQNWRR